VSCRRLLVSAIALLAASGSGCAGADGDELAPPSDQAPPAPPISAASGPYEAEVAPPGRFARAVPVRPRLAAGILPPPVMHANFEPASAVCNDWTAEDADAIRSVPPHSGTYACRICATGDAPDITLARDVDGPLRAGRYVLTAWLRKPPNHPGAAGPAVAQLEADTAEGTRSSSSSMVMTDDYAMVTVTLDLATEGTAIRARIRTPANASECLLIDDVLVERLIH
jgi:hypothetical protein